MKVFELGCIPEDALCYIGEEKDNEKRHIKDTT
jgi:hypothetical protein